MTLPLVFGHVSNFYDDEGPSQTITVWEEAAVRPSLVLSPNGEPFQLETKKKMGSDLTPKDNNNARKNNSERL
jgi:hypothetical protein